MKQIQGGHENQLSAEEEEAMERFLLVPADEEPAVGEEVAEEEDNFEGQLKRARLANPIVGKSKYMNLTFIKPDTCVVERLFSLTNKVWVEGRKSMMLEYPEKRHCCSCIVYAWIPTVSGMCPGGADRGPLDVWAHRAIHSSIFNLDRPMCNCVDM